MTPLPVTILQHTARSASHYDWLMADPRNPSGPLWAARLAQPPRCWVPGSAMLLTPLTPHRRLYLRYQGPLSAGRGAVVRVDQGQALPTMWTIDRVELLLRLRGFVGRVSLRRIGPGLFRAHVARRPPA